MSEFDMLRHSIKDGGDHQMLGPQGRALARLVGRHHLRDRGYTHYACSTRFRTMQTLDSMAEGAGDFRITYVPSYAPIYPRIDGAEALFRACKEAELRGEPIYAAARLCDPAMVAKMAQAAAELFHAWVAELPADARVLVIGHSPSLEILLLGLCDMTIPSLRECHGYGLTVEAGKGIRGKAEVRANITDPRFDPSSLRATL